MVGVALLLPFLLHVDVTYVSGVSQKGRLKARNDSKGQNKGLWSTTGFGWTDRITR